MSLEWTRWLLLPVMIPLAVLAIGFLTVIVFVAAGIGGVKAFWEDGIG